MREEMEKYSDLCLPLAEAEMLASLEDSILKLGFKESRRYGQLHKVNIHIIADERPPLLIHFRILLSTSPQRSKLAFTLGSSNRS